MKCSGSDPCTRCARKKQRCHFPPEDVRVSVSERSVMDVDPTGFRTNQYVQVSPSTRGTSESKCWFASFK